MAPERAEWRALADRKQRERSKRNESELRHLAQAGIPAQAVTGSEEWDYFLTLIQSQIEALEEALLMLRAAQVLDPSFEYADLAMRKAQQMQIAVQIETLKGVRDLPKQIIEQGEKAKLELHKLTDE